MDWNCQAISTLPRIGLPDMYDSLSNFLVSLSEHRGVWAVFVIGTMVTLSLILYGFWEIVLRIPRLCATLWKKISEDRALHQH